ncbi:MAG: fimbrial protein [Stenotrophomonas sp.]|uniref:fimbrial protein n=1 Tax=Stenotrophomonas sp. TaxID=69392 RepID=UPI003D6D8CB4
MKKTIITAALVAIVGGVAPSAFAADGKIAFKGLVNDVTCSVTGGAGTDGAAKDFTVTLDTVSKTALAVAGARAGDKAFSVQVGGAGEAGCTNGKLVSLKFEPAQSPVDSATGRLINQAGTGAAEFVQIGLLDKEGADINLVDGSGNPVATIAGNTATLDYFAQYYAAKEGVTSGTVDTFVMYSAGYN